MELGMAGYAAAAGAAGAGIGLELFEYNRGNYMMDQKLHFARFTAGANLAIAQVKQYRQDIQDLTTLTVGRMDYYHGAAGMILTIATAVLCPGRVGLHEPPPPSWHMGLEFANLGGAYIFLGLTMWFAMHASLRADSAMVHMLTRFVRLPVPANWMLDRARKFLSSFEEQPLKEAFRIPFFRHMGNKKGGESAAELDMDPDALRRSRHGNDVPAWYRKEKYIDQNEPYESMMPLQAIGTAPEHFEVYREIQNEWWPYDVYSRICMLLAFMHLTFAWGYQQIGHHFCENRCVFAAGCVVIPICCLQQILLTLDIMPHSQDKNVNILRRFPWHRLGPFGPLFGWIGLAIEYKRWWNPNEAIVGWVSAYIAYLLHIIFTLQLLRICAPDYSKAPDQAEVPAGSWWPGTWALPSSFKHAIWLVAPPRSLEPGQNDLAGEMRAAVTGADVRLNGGGLTASAAESKRRDVHRALGKQGESPAWFNVRVGLSALVIAWLYLVVGFTVDIINQGTEHPSLLSAPGMPDNLRDPRYRPPKVGYEEPTEIGTGGVNFGPAHGLEPFAVQRRLLSDIQGSDIEVIKSELPQQAIAELIRGLVPQLNELASFASQMRINYNYDALPHAAVSTLSRVPVTWPALLSPRLMACAPQANHLLALSQHGRGATVVAGKTKVFSLEGVARHRPLIAASWNEHGLLLASATGAVLECPGSGPAHGRWHCKLAFEERLPLGEHFSGAVSLSRLGNQSTPGVKAVVAFPGETFLTLYSHSGDVSDVWLPAGELRTSSPVLAVAFTALAQEVTAVSADGFTRQLSTATGLNSGKPLRSPRGNSHAVCTLFDGKVAQLASTSQSSEPMLWLN
jgi:hypothetical protein